MRVLFCDDSGGAVRGFTLHVADALPGRIEARTTSSLDGFRQIAAAEEPFDVVISDLNFEQVGGGSKDGLWILREAKQRWPECEIVLLTAYCGSLGVDEGLELSQMGLHPGNLFRKTSSDDPALLWERLRERLIGIQQSRTAAEKKVGELENQGFFHRSRALEDTLALCTGEGVEAIAGRIRSDPSTCMHGIIGRSYALRQVLERLERAARRQSTVLILGETGTGKELVARALHAASPRSQGPLVKTDIASLSRELVAAELFGHERGAYTRAQGTRKGLVLEADGGVLFFDEIGNLDRDAQAGLLRLLEDRTFRPLGASKDRSVDVMVVAATHVDLEQEIREGRFRSDLVERLSVVVLELPPLRDRREDIPLLAVTFLDELRRKFGVRGLDRIEAAALRVLVQHPWPRNVRQLRNTMERLFSEIDDNVSPVGAEHIRAVLPRVVETEPLPDVPLSRRVLDGTESRTLAEIARQYGEDVVREVIRDTFVELEGPPDDATCARLFHGMKSNTWRQFAFKRGLTYRAIKKGDGPDGPGGHAAC